MTVKRIINLPLRLVCVFALLAPVTSCIKENPDDCQTDTGYELTVRAFGESGEELTREVVADVTLFVFDGDLRFIECIDAHVNEPVKVNISGDMHIVGWGNLACGLQSCPIPNAGDHKDNCFVELLQDNRIRARSYSLSPGDIFRGELSVSRQEQTGEKEIHIHRQVGSLTVTMRNLKTFAGFADDDYHIIVRETFCAIDFSGNLSGGNTTAYRPDGSFVTNAGKEEYYVPSFILLPGGDMCIDIYHGSTLIATVSRDNDGNPIAVERGRLTNVLIDLKAGVSVSVALTEWDKECLWKEF